MPLNVFVTGSTGFLGGHLIRLLSARGHQVRAGYRDPKRLEIIEGLDVEPVHVDILDPGSLASAFTGADLVFHAAGYVGSAEHAWRVNSLAPRLVVAAAAQAGVQRVVHTSSVVAIGPAPPGERANEESLYRGGKLGLTYVDSKHEGEVEALKASLQFGVDLVVANPAYMIGVPADRSLAAASSARILVAFLHGGMPVIVDGLTNVVDVRDVAAGHLLVAEQGRRGERYILGGTNIAWTAIVRRLLERTTTQTGATLVLPPELAPLAHAQHLLGIPPIFTGGLLTRLAAPAWQYDSSKAQAELGYEPRPLDETLDEIVDWSDSLRDTGVILARPEAARWQRILALARRVGLLRGMRRLERRLDRSIIIDR